MGGQRRRRRSVSWARLDAGRLAACLDPDLGATAHADLEREVSYLVHEFRIEDAQFNEPHDQVAELERFRRNLRAAWFSLSMPVRTSLRGRRAAEGSRDRLRAPYAVLALTEWLHIAPETLAPLDADREVPIVLDERGAPKVSAVDAAFGDIETAIDGCLDALQHFASVRGTSGAPIGDARISLFQELQSLFDRHYYLRRKPARSGPDGRVDERARSRYRSDLWAFIALVCDAYGIKSPAGGRSTNSLDRTFRRYGLTPHWMRRDVLPSSDDTSGQ